MSSRDSLGSRAASQVKPAGGSQAAARAGAAATGTNGGSIGDAAQSASARTAAAPIDPTKQYRVQPGDSLYKIAVKLYGKSSYVGKIHEANKETLGSDEHPLIKPGQVLTLPEPPTQQQQSAGQPQAAAAGR